MVAIGYLSVVLVGLAGLVTAAPTEGDMTGQVNMESRYVKATFGGPGAKAKWRVRDEAVGSLAKRIACSSGSCKVPSTFGKKYKVAGAVRSRDANALDERDNDFDGYLTKRIACSSGNCKVPSTFGKKYKVAGAVKIRDADSLDERDDTKAILEARGTGSRLAKTLKNHFLPFARDENGDRNPVTWVA